MTASPTPASLATAREIDDGIAAARDVVRHAEFMSVDGHDFKWNNNTVLRIARGLLALDAAALTPAPEAEDRT